jgi:poly-gamma-glutamate synthesis protein (capsule biosynthesis protein)
LKLKGTDIWYIHILQGLILFFSLASFISLSFGKEMKDAERPAGQKSKLTPITLFLTGDVMTGRGIDQVLPHPLDPRLYEPYVKDADRYVVLAEEANGPIKRPVDWPYIWGVALGELGRLKPDVRIINLETSVTKSDEYWRGKGINYRMHPKNIPAIKAAGIDVAVLANNHVLDWGYAGLEETLETLRRAKISYAGAGLNLKAAEAPAIREVGGKGRVLVFSYGSGSSGVPPSWAASHKRPGVNLLNDLSGKTIDGIREKVNEVRRRADIVIVSLHWGSN